VSQVLKWKENECNSLNGKFEDEQTLAGKINNQLKELQSCLEELDKARGALRRELD
jgi:hypothetical protein